MLGSARRRTVAGMSSSHKILAIALSAGALATPAASASSLTPHGGAPDESTVATAVTHRDKAIDAALAQEQYYSTSARSAPLRHAQPSGNDGSPLPVIAIGLGAAGFVGALTVTGRHRVRIRRTRVAA
jgi:hypothetical protein